MQASIFGACLKPGYIGRVVPGRASGIKMVGMAEMEAPISLDGVAVYRDCWCVCLLFSFCTRKSRRWQNIPSGTSSSRLSRTKSRELQNGCVNVFM